MNNLNQQQKIYYKNQLVNFIHFDKIYYAVNMANDDYLFEQRVIIEIGTETLNIASRELTN